MPRRQRFVDAGSVHIETGMGGDSAPPKPGKCPDCGAKLENGKGHVCKAARVDHATENLTGVEIFDVGTWNGRKNTDQDLNDMVESFKAIGHLIKPFVKLGHDDDQQLLQEDGYPAGGWVTNLYRMGSKLVADFAGVPAVIAKLVRAGAYRRVSSEIYQNLKEEATGKVFRRVLGAVAFLGGEMPAVTTLNDIVALGYSSESDPDIALYERGESDPMKTCKHCKKSFSADDMADGTDYCKTCNSRKDHGANPPAAEPGTITVSREDFASLQSTVAKLTETVTQQATQLKDATDRAATATATLDLYAKETARERAEATVEAAIKDGRLVPAQRDRARALFAALGTTKVKYTRDTQEVEETPAQILEGFLASIPKGVHQRELLANADGVQVQVAAGADEASSVLKARAERYAKEHKVSFREALLEVGKTH